MTYLTSPSKRVLLVQQQRAVKVQDQRAHDDAKSCLFFGWEGAEAEAQYTPRRRAHRYRACREGSWEGVESCWRGRQRRSLWRTQGVTTMEIAPSCGVIYCIFVVWHKNHRGDPKTCNSGFTVARGSVAPVRLWSQNREHAVLMSRIQCQGGRF